MPAKAGALNARHRIVSDRVAIRIFKVQTLLKGEITRMPKSPYGERGYCFLCNSDAALNPLELDFRRSNVQGFATLVPKKFPPKCPSSLPYSGGRRNCVIFRTKWTAAARGFLMGDSGIEVQGGLNIPAHSRHRRYSRAVLEVTTSSVSDSCRSTGHI